MTIGSKMAVTVFLLFLLHLAPSVQAREPEPEGSTTGWPAPYAKDRLSAQFVAGALFGPVSWVHKHHTFNYFQTNLRIGWMASEPKESKYFGRGNFELLFELTNSVIFEGTGTYLRGVTFLGRYNLLLPDPKWALYFQIGAGAIVNDAYPDMSQSEIGQNLEFTPQASIGLRHFIGPRWSLDGEAMYHHISNAGLSHRRNGGINAVGGLLGVTYFLDKL